MENIIQYEIIPLFSSSSSPDVLLLVSKGSRGCSSQSAALCKRLTEFIFVVNQAKHLDDKQLSFYIVSIH